MSVAGLIEIFRDKQKHYEVLSDGILCLKTGSSHGAVHGVLLRELEAGWVQGAMEFFIKGRDIPAPDELCAQITEFTGQAVNAHFSEYLGTIYLNANFQRKTLVEDVEQFADICEDFSAMLDRLEEIGDWDENLLQLTFGGSASIH